MRFTQPRTTSLSRINSLDNWHLSSMFFFWFALSGDLSCENPKESAVVIRPEVPNSCTHEHTGARESGSKRQWLTLQTRGESWRCSEAADVQQHRGLTQVAVLRGHDSRSMCSCLLLLYKKNDMSFSRRSALSPRVIKLSEDSVNAAAGVYRVSPQ